MAVTLQMAIIQLTVDSTWNSSKTRKMTERRIFSEKLIINRDSADFWGGVGRPRSKWFFTSCRDLKLLRYNLRFFDFDRCPEILPNINILYLHVITLSQIQLCDPIEQKLVWNIFWACFYRHFIVYFNFDAFLVIFTDKIEFSVLAQIWIFTGNFTNSRQYLRTWVEIEKSEMMTQIV